MVRGHGITPNVLNKCRGDWSVNDVPSISTVGESYQVCVTQKVFGCASVRISCTKVREIRATTGFTANTWHNALIK